MSKGLEALSDLWYGKKTTETYQIIEKELKALEIIKKYDLKSSDITRFDNYEDFIQFMRERYYDDALYHCEEYYE